MKTSLIYLLILTFTLILLPSCKTQCQILEEQISICKSYLDCDKNDEDIICKEVAGAYDLISVINNKVSEGTDDKVETEKACSYAIANIKVNNCIDAQENQKKEWLNDNPDKSIKNIMSNFGISSSIDKINPTINFETELLKTPSIGSKCGEKILNEYKDSKRTEKTMKISILEEFSEVVPIIQINPESSNSNIFIGDKYIKNGNSPCDFNKNNRLLGEKGSDIKYNYKNYDYIFCSKSSGWLSETKNTRSNCALTRQEIFLIDWDKDYFTQWCSENYKNNSNNSCSDGNDYKCVSAYNDTCYNLREDFLCENLFKTCKKNCIDDDQVCSKTCEENYESCNLNNTSNCKNRCLVDKCFFPDTPDLENKFYEDFYLSFYDCLENEDYSSCDCKEKCSSGSANCSVDNLSNTCIECQKDCSYNCIKDKEINLTTYGNNIAKIEECFYNKIEEIKKSSNTELTTCINNNSNNDSETSCNKNCEYDTCIYSCLKDNCSKGECFKDSTCKSNSCYYNCQKECDTLKVNAETSHRITFYREVEDEITGSNCNEKEVFTDKNYCVVEYKIFE